MQIASVNPSSMVNGDGIRLVIVFQGCSLDCDECFSPELFDFKKGKTVSASRLARMIATAYKDDSYMLDGITLSGGNPPEQKELEAFLKELKKIVPKLNIWMWTGFTWDELQANKPFMAQLEYIDVVVTGRYEKDKKIEHHYFGSSNQEVWRRTDGEWVKDK